MSCANCHSQGDLRTAKLSPSAGIFLDLLAQATEGETDCHRSDVSWTVSSAVVTMFWTDGSTETKKVPTGLY